MKMEEKIAKKLLEAGKLEYNLEGLVESFVRGLEQATMRQKIFFLKRFDSELLYVQGRNSFLTKGAGLAFLRVGGQLTGQASL